MPTILVIDDDPDIARYTKLFFEKLNFKIISATSAKEAIGYINQTHPDIILLDKGLPDMDGLQLLQRLKSKDFIKNIPVIMLTADTSQKSVLVARRLKVFDYIIKPIKQNILTRKVYNAWKMIQLERAMQQVKEDSHIVLERLPGMAVFKFEGQITLSTYDKFKDLLNEQFWKSTKGDEYVLDFVPQPEFDSIQMDILRKIFQKFSGTKKNIRCLVGQNYPQLLELGLNPETQLFIVIEDIQAYINN